MLGVVDHQHHGVLVIAHPVQEGRPGGEKILARKGADSTHAQQRSEPGRQPRAFLGVGHVAVQADFEQDSLVLVTAERVVGHQLEAATDRFGQREERHALAVRQAPAAVPPHRGAQTVGVRLELPPQPGLDHAGLTVHDEQGGGASPRLRGRAP